MKSLPSLQEEAHCWTRRYEELREQVLAGESLIVTERSGIDFTDQTRRGRLDASLA